MRMLQYRSFEKEQMDDLNLAGKKLHQTLYGLSVINRYLGNTNATFKAVKREMLKADGPLKIIDLGCGGGDNLRAIAAWSVENGKPAELIGIDGNPYILEYARAKNTKQVQVKFLQADILEDSFELPDCDLLISSHFMYHFSDEAFVRFLEGAKEKVTKKIIFSELERNPLAYLLFKIGAIFFPFSKMVKQDGLKAIRRAFTRKELISIFKEAGLINYRIKWKWAFRLIIFIPLYKLK